MEAWTQLLGVDIHTSSCFHCNYNNNVSSNVHVLPLWLAGLHLGPCSVLPGTRLVRQLPISHRVLQYGYHISALNQIQATLTCRAAPPLHSHGLPTCIPMSDAMFSLVTSMFTVGGFLGSSIAGMVMERHGRKAALQFSGLFVAVGSGLMAIAPSTVLLLLGRQ
jgi:MFS family permease